MNRTQAKARAAQLGISKEVARTFGNLSKTQTWLDAIAAHEAPNQCTSAQLEDPSSVTEDVEPCNALPRPAVTSETVDEPQTVAVASEEPYPDPWTPEPVATETAEPTSSAKSAVPLVYPFLLLLVIAWVACQLLLGLGSLLAVGLKSLAQQADKAATAHLVQLRTAQATPPTAPAPTLQPEG